MTKPDPKSKDYARQLAQTPREILLDPNLSLASKGLYAVLLLEPGHSMSYLGTRLKEGRRAIGRPLKELQKAELAVRRGASRSTSFMARPSAKASEEKVARLKRALPMVVRAGEFLMDAWLDEEIASDDYINNARPQFLRNPVTNQPMEYDRFYPPGAAFEFNGPQHYGATSMFPSEADAREQQLRDLAKIGMSLQNGVTPVTVTWEDLSHKGMSPKIPDSLPKREVDPKDPFIKTLEEESARYRNAIRKAMRDWAPPEA